MIFYRLSWTSVVVYCCRGRNIKVNRHRGFLDSWFHFVTDGACKHQNPDVRAYLFEQYPSDALAERVPVWIHRCYKRMMAAGKKGCMHCPTPASYQELVFRSNSQADKCTIIICLIVVHLKTWKCRNFKCTNFFCRILIFVP